MFWDAGKGLELPQVYLTGWLVYIASVVLTLLAWTAGYGMLGGSY
jgi:succinate dehydrogenase / fumarate reductase cytochrome b subunit